MFFKSRYIAFFLLTITLSACSHSQGKLSFTPLTILFRTDTLGEGRTKSITRFEEYLVENYSDNKEAQRQIDSFAFSHTPSDIGKYTSYQMVFYKKTAQTTVETIKDYKDRVPPESLDDIIFDYWWNRGKFLVRYKFKNGKIVDPPDNVNVTNVSTDSIQ